MATDNHHPIIYVRGFAGTQGEIEDTVADPYMGFNIGSVKCRQNWTGEVKKFFFESPLVRLFKEQDYDDVYVDGLDQVLDKQGIEKIPYRSVVIYRYYEQASKDMGAGKLPEMETFATGLSDLILRLKEKVVENKANRVKPQDFRVYLVAHSMGGLVCRAFLQNPKLGVEEAKKAVDKVFTYATPHNGIDMALIGNVPGWFGLNNTNDFNRERMAKYLGLEAELKKTGRASYLKNFDADRFFCLVGTNANDYSVMKGLSRMAAGQSSDGLVRIENATTRGLNAKGEEVNSPRAFVHRSHSGYYGIVNSEEGYQNMTRFFFGNVRVDGILEVEELTLPEDLQKQKNAGKEIRASYHFEVVVSVRGKQWEMHRRTVNENSAFFCKYDDLFPKSPGEKPTRPHLFSAFLDATQRINTRSASLGFALDLRVLVPDYQVNGFLWMKNHYEGGHIFRDRIYCEATPPANKKESWKLNYGFESQTPNDAPLTAEGVKDDSGLTFSIALSQPIRPGFKATLKIKARPWA